MIDLASIVLRGFQDDLVSVFGSSIGWAAGHLILLSALVFLVLVVRERDHIMNQSGLNRKVVLGGIILTGLTLLNYWIFTYSFGYPNGTSVWLAALTAISLYWMVEVMG